MTGICDQGDKCKYAHFEHKKGVLKSSANAAAKADAKSKAKADAKAKAKAKAKQDS